ncbi:MAG: TatD family hydrolase [Anaerolineales bacterium]|jgi:TatD DNase family protein|nr:TatD family hydrolase [Anaerolineales bacterium]
MSLTDTHCHLDFEKFDADRQEVLQRARQAGLTRILIPGLDLHSSLRAVKLAQSDPMLYAAIGFHPTDALQWDAASFTALEKLSTSEKVVAIGEIGLDYYWDAAPHDLQRRVLTQQLNLAERANLPVLIHLREAGDAEAGDCAADLLKILEEWVIRLRGAAHPLAEGPGVLHSFSGSLQTAEKALDFGFYIGITGPVTYKNAEMKRQVVAGLPLDKVLIETDAPFLAPIPRRGKRNEPAFVVHIADKIGEIHKIDPQEVAKITSANAARLFGWGGDF